MPQNASTTRKTSFLPPFLSPPLVSPPSTSILFSCHFCVFFHVLQSISTSSPLTSSSVLHSHHSMLSTIHKFPPSTCILFSCHFCVLFHVLQSIPTSSPHQLSSVPLTCYTLFYNTTHKTPHITYSNQIPRNT